MFCFFCFVLFLTCCHVVVVVVVIIIIVFYNNYRKKKKKKIYIYNNGNDKLCSSKSSSWSPDVTSFANWTTAHLRPSFPELSISFLLFLKLAMFPEPHVFMGHSFARRFELFLSKGADEGCDGILTCPVPRR